MDLSTRSASSADPAVTSRLRHLHQLLQQRVRRGIDVAPPLLRAGVLIPLIRRGNGVELLFTRRTDTVLTHKGQISFPGGQQEERDVETVETALRESYEEIGLEPSRVTVLGELDVAEAGGAQGQEEAQASQSPPARYRGRACA